MIKPINVGFWGLAVTLSLSSALLGAAIVCIIQNHLTSQKIVKTNELQLVDEEGTVRAQLSLHSDKTVSFVIISKEKIPVVELGSGESLNHYTGAGHLIIRDSQSTPIVALGGYGNSKGSMLFSTASTRSQVAVGYQPDGDVIDGHDRAIWGIGVRGASHSWSGIGAQTDNGLFQGFISAQK